MTPILGRETVYAERTRQYTGQAWMPKSLTTSIHFRVTRPSNQTKEPLICHEPTSGPWEKVAWHLHTWWWELSWHSRLLLWLFRSGSVTQQNRNCHHNETWRHFVTHGTPNELLSGNELPFNSAEFDNFLRSSGTEHVTISRATPKAMDE